MKRIGIFGGSFDPVHTGHILIAEAAREQFRLDLVLFVPARRSPHKPRAIYAPANHRLAMVKAATRGRAGFRAADLELGRSGLSYSVDTVQRLAEADPRAKLFLLIGSDNMRSFHAWREPGKIAALAKIIVYKRAGHEVTASSLKRWNASLLRGAEIFISSTAVRRRVAEGKTIRHFVPPAVERHIRRNRLYRRR